MYSNCPIDLNPYAQSNVIKTPNIVSTNYTNQDFWSMKTRLIKFIRERFGPSGTEIPNTFNDFVESSIAIMLIENWAFLADTLSFKMDQLVNELFIDTVTQLDNAFRLAQLVGFTPQPPIASKSMWSATANAVRTADISIPTPFQVNFSVNGAPLTIELFQGDANGEPIFGADIVIPSGQIVNSSVVGLEGKTYTNNFTGNGNPSQTLTLQYSPVLYGSVSVIVDGVNWNQVEYFTDSQPRAEYLFTQDSNWVGYIIFGNNSAGLIPSNGSSIQVTYRYGGGTQGNIIANYGSSATIGYLVGATNGVPVSLTNYTPGTGGYDGDTIDIIRAKLPAWLRSQNRAVSGLDYKTLTDQFATPYQGSIGKSVAVLRNYGCAGNIVDLYILALNGTMDLQIASNGLKVALNEYLVNLKMLTDYLCIRDGTVIYVDTAIEVSVDKSFVTLQDQINTSIVNQVNSFFSLANWEYGQTLNSTDLTRSLANINQVTNFTISFTTSDPNNSGDSVYAQYYEIIRPDEINISFIYS